MSQCQLQSSTATCVTTQNGISPRRRRGAAAVPGAGAEGGGGGAGPHGQRPHVCGAQRRRRARRAARRQPAQVRPPLLPRSLLLLLNKHLEPPLGRLSAASMRVYRATLPAQSRLCTQSEAATSDRCPQTVTWCSLRLFTEASWGLHSAAVLKHMHPQTRQFMWHAALHFMSAF